mgnify:FL=1
MIVISEPAYTVSNWYAQIVAGLKSQARKKRLPLHFYSNMQSAGQSGGCVFIIGSSYSWLYDAVADAHQFGCHPILLNNQPHRSFPGKYSYVSADISLSVSYILQLLTQAGKHEIALYGINPASVADISRKETFAAQRGHADIYYNRTSFLQCFDSFFQKAQEKQYDAVICANDYAAISLIYHLKTLGYNTERLSVISYSNTLLAQRCNSSVSSIELHYEKFGQAAMMISENIEKDPYLTGMNVFVDWKLVFRDTALESEMQKQISFSSQTDVSRPQDLLFADKELIEMMRLENLLLHCDETDMRILHLLCTGTSLYKIAEVCYLTENALKYRIKKMKEICDVPSKTDLIRSFNKYNIRL